MDRLQLAEEHFEHLLPLLRPAMTVAASDQVEVWLRDWVAPVADDLRRHQRFQQLARWSVDHLTPGARTPERRMVEAVDQALLDMAQAILKALDGGAASQPMPRAAAKSYEPAGRNRVTAAVSDMATVEWVAKRPWFDLACAEEYFQASRGPHLLKSDPVHSRAFIERHELRVPLGDYVLRALLARIEYWTGLLDPVWQQCFLGQAAGASHAFGERMFTAKTNLQQKVADLRAACLAGPAARLREACVSLTQVYAAYHSCPELAWLGCPPGWGTGHGGLIRSVIRPPGPRGPGHAEGAARAEGIAPKRESLCRDDVVRAIATALLEVRELYRRPVESEEFINWAASTKQLLLVDRRPQALYWQGQLVPGTWDRWPTRWELLWKLAQRAQRQQPVHREELTPPGDSTRAVVNRRHHLSGDLPPGLDQLIEDVRPGGYRLNLAAEAIMLLQLDHEEQLVEATAEQVPLW